MKKILFLSVLAAMLLSVSPVRAQLQSQLSTETATFIYADNESIVRNVDDKYVVGYIKKGISSYFYASDVSGFDGTGTSLAGCYYTFNLPVNWTVKDIFYANGLTFFCGCDGANAMYGWFNTNDLISGSPLNYTCYSFSGVDTLTHLVVPNPNAVDPLIIATGVSTWATSHINYLVQIENGSTVNYAPLSAYGGAPTQELNDVKLAGENVVFVGTDRSAYHSSPNAFCLRFANWKHLTTDPSIHIRYDYIDPSVSSMPFFRAAMNIIMSDSIIAVTHKASDDASETRLAQIDINSKFCTSVQSCPGIDRAFLRGLVYLPKQAALISLEQRLSFTHFVRFMPMMVTPYITDIFEPLGQPYISLDAFGNGNIISVFSNNWFMQKYPILQSCNAPIGRNISFKNQYQKLMVKNPVPFYSTTAAPLSSIAITPYVRINTICVH